MSATPPDHSPESPLDVNPYAAPEAPIGAPLYALDAELAAAEATRRRYLTHETNVKSIGSLYQLVAILLFVALVGGAYMYFAGPRGEVSPVLQVTSGFYVLMFFVSVAMGYGLTRLQPWARWTAVALAGILLIFIFGIMLLALVATTLQGAGSALAVGALVWSVPGLILGFILYLLLSPKSGVVFSHEYKDVIARTPHIKYKMSCIVKGFLWFLLAFILLGVGAAIFGGLQR